MTNEERSKLAAEALRGDADRRVRAAVAAAAELDADESIRDKRTGALRIVRILAEAAELRRAADELLASPAPAPLPDLDAALAVAHAEATGQAAELDDPVATGSPNGADAPIMGSTSEDEPADHEVETVLAE